MRASCVDGRRSAKPQPPRFSLHPFGWRTQALVAPAYQFDNDAEMSELGAKNLLRPDRTLRFPGLSEDVIELGDWTVGRVSQEPGWGWSTHMRPHVGGEWCQAR